MDAATIGILLTASGGTAGAVVAYLGKRGENAITGYSSLTTVLQKELDKQRIQLAELHAQRAADMAEMTRLRIENARLGGPS